GGNGLVRQPLRHQREDVHFTRRERLDGGLLRDEFFTRPGGHRRSAGARRVFGDRRTWRHGRTGTLLEIRRDHQRVHVGRRLPGSGEGGVLGGYFERRRQ